MFGTFLTQLVIILQVTDEQNCEEEVFPLSVIYLDQVVSVLTVRKSCLQLAACVCMFIASKFRETNHLSSNVLVMYTDSAFTVDQLLVLLPLSVCLSVCLSVTISRPY